MFPFGSPLEVVIRLSILFLIFGLVFLVKTDDPAPPGYRITHVHRDNPDQTKGGGLVVIHRDEINVSPNKDNIFHSSFEFQLVNIGLQSRDIVLANIYRPPSSSKSIFLEEFGSLLATLGTNAADRLMISGDFNLPGTSPNTIDDDLADLLNSTGSTQLDTIQTTQDPLYSTSSSLHPPQNLFLQLLLSVPMKFLTTIWHSLTSQLNATNPPREYINIET